MKFCRGHWTTLRGMVEEKGMKHLIKTNAKEAFDSMIKELKGDNNIIDYDPLMSSYWTLSARAIEVGGIYLLGVKPDGSEYCPMCEVQKHIPVCNCGKCKGETSAIQWMEGCTDAVLEYCKENSLVVERKEPIK